MKESKRYHLTFWLWALFGVSVMVRFYLAMKTGVINTNPDELLYWKTSRALLHGDAPIFRGYASPSKDLLYPLAIAAAHLLGDFSRSYHTILLINAVLMSTTVFAVYLLAKAALDDPRQALFLAVVGAAAPELFLSAGIVQECLYFPYVIWMFWLFYVFLLKNKYSILRVALFSVLLCLAFYMKGIGHCLVLAFFAFYGVQIIFCGTFLQKLKSVILLLESVGICLAVDHLVVVYYFKSSMTPLDQMIMMYVNSVLYKFGQWTPTFFQLCAVFLAGVVLLTLLVACLRFIGKKLWRYKAARVVFLIAGLALIAGAGYALHRSGYLAPLTTYLVYTNIIWGVFPILISLAYMREMLEKQRDIFFFLMVLWLITLFAACFSTLNLATDVSREAIRIHYRYFCYPALGFFVLFLSMQERLKERGMTLPGAACGVAFLILLIVAVPARMGSMIDAVPLYSMQGFLYRKIGLLLFKLILILYILYGARMLWRKRIREFYRGAFLFIGCICVFSAIGAYRAQSGERADLVSKGRDGERLAEYFDGKEIGEDANKILLVADSWISSIENTEVHLDVPYRVSLWQDITLPEVLVNGELQGGLLNLYMGEWPYRIDGYVPQYIVSLHPVALAAYEAEQIGLENYYLYVRSDL